MQFQNILQFQKMFDYLKYFKDFLLEVYRILENSRTIQDSSNCNSEKSWLTISCISEHENGETFQNCLKEIEIKILKQVYENLKMWTGVQEGLRFQKILSKKQNKFSVK